MCVFGVSVSVFANVVEMIVFILPATVWHIRHQLRFLSVSTSMRDANPRPCRGNGYIVHCATNLLRTENVTDGDGSGDETMQWIAEQQL